MEKKKYKLQMMDEFDKYRIAKKSLKYINKFFYISVTIKKMRSQIL